MMAAFLDSVGIAHEEGLITQEDVAKPETRQAQSGRRGGGRAVPARGRRPLSLHARVAGSRHVGRAHRDAGNDSRLTERAHFGGRPPAAFDRAVHVTLPVLARVLACKQDSACRPRQPLPEAGIERRIEHGVSSLDPGVVVPHNCLTREKRRGVPGRREPGSPGGPRLRPLRARESSATRATRGRRRESSGCRAARAAARSHPRPRPSEDRSRTLTCRVAPRQNRRRELQQQPCRRSVHQRADGPPLVVRELRVEDHVTQRRRRHRGHAVVRLHLTVVCRRARTSPQRRSPSASHA